MRLARPWRRLRTSLEGRLPLPITHVVDVDHPEAEAVVVRRRRVVAATSLLGATVLGLSLSTQPGSRRFYVLTLSTAATWIAGGLASGPLHLGWIQTRDLDLRRPVLTPLATGAGAFGFFYLCALAVRRVPTLDRAVGRVLDFAGHGNGPLVLLTTYANGVGEEVFFRGALYATLTPERAVATSTAVYALATTTTRNPALVLAAGVMGALLGMQRRASGGIQAPLITHLTWSTLMVRYLPPLFRRAHARAGGPGRVSRG
jgi:membrane protease YdiL (CAAX protease family)